MINTIYYASALAGIVIVLTAPLYFIFLFNLLKYIKLNKTDLWEKLGRPSVLNLSPTTAAKVVKFVSTDGLKYSNDSTLFDKVRYTKLFLYLSSISVFVIIFGQVCIAVLRSLGMK